MSSLQCAVIGVGYLGRFHAQKYKMLPNVELIGVCDAHPTTCDAVAAELNVPAYYNYKDLFGSVDAVSIAATTSQHFAIAKDCIAAGIHVLIEKPITQTVTEADTLIALAQQQGVKLQVGHLERFNSARLALEAYIDRPLFNESERLAPFNPRGADVNVILDLMIHDIDLIQAIVKSPITHIDAEGAPILSQGIDIANARIKFANQCVANISIDYQNKKFAVFNKGEGEMFPGIPDIIRHESVFENTDALLAEITSFVHCILEDTTPLVTGNDGRDALATAETINQRIAHNLTLRHDLA
jgi:predicted dehydrogenase